MNILTSISSVDIFISFIKKQGITIDFQLIEF